MNGSFEVRSEKVWENDKVAGNLVVSHGMSNLNDSSIAERYGDNLKRLKADTRRQIRHTF